mmetsp:Transcript_36165/g.86422  ORF Transcript_36165/g.86422 Transcript_36165/m.86422 type:complete len:162 (-) Transcript_36165:167-652(-)
MAAADTRTERQAMCCKCTSINPGVPGETKFMDDCFAGCHSYCAEKEYMGGTCDMFTNDWACEQQDDAAEAVQDAGEDMDLVICCKCQREEWDFGSLVPVEGYGCNPYAPFNDDDSPHNEYLKCMGLYHDQGDKKTCKQECAEKHMFGGMCDMTPVHKSQCK